MIDSTFLFNFTITWVQTRGEKAAWGSSCTWGGRGEGWDIRRSFSSCSYYPGGERGGKRRGGRWQRWGGGAQGQDVHTIIELGHSGCFSSQEPFLILSPMHNSCQLAALGVFKYLITPRKSFKKTVSTFNLKLNRKPQLGLEPVEQLLPNSSQILTSQTLMVIAKTLYPVAYLKSTVSLCPFVNNM